ncbi:LMBR1 domain-containing protein 1 [Trypanosoma rangeli]|uniref:LMBR1 domain-containing protein 1 n=1 Tax=Trypanosoma rangeli TaxID=5698 RepID=A0A422P212_TRYRA|nr:LMBR1 domain-containing protein 1 [Trypanosoma rangeli]RNF11739.1 LMBR1 domain-containing protein 1 [Trypanosoma rangeli]|eukprot:RNF11739.1 LMBR1 domain-containing protein 1 [Trypanosoma rangeli]
MLNWWLIVLLVAVALMCVGLGVYVLFYFVSEEEDRGDHGARVVVVLGMVIAMGVVLLLPLDVANATDPTVPNKYANTLNVQLMWQIVLWIVLILAIIVLPFVLFFYEAFDPENNRLGRQIGQALVYSLAVFGVFAIICGVCYGLVGVARVPVRAYVGFPQLVLDVEHVVYNGSSVSSHEDIGVSFFTYCVGIMCFLGWIAFFFYGGVGLVSFPIGLICSFVRRTKAISGSRFAEEMAIIAAKSDALLELSLEMQRKCRGSITASQRNKINILRNETYILEAQQEQLIWAYTKAGGSPFVVYGRLMLGIISSVISVAWLLHIFVYNTFDASPFLNGILTSLDGTFAFFGVIAYGVFVFYLMWVTFEGQMRLGMRLVFLQIHPLKPHDTTLNSLLFNVALCLLTTPAVVEFAARSFQEYGPRTAINALMNIYVLHLKGIGYFIMWAQFCFVGVSLLSVVWVILCPVTKRRRDPTKLRL